MLVETNNYLSLLGAEARGCGLLFIMKELRLSLRLRLLRKLGEELRNIEMRAFQFFCYFELVCEKF